MSSIQTGNSVQVRKVILFALVLSLIVLALFVSYYYGKCFSEDGIQPMTPRIEKIERLLEANSNYLAETNKQLVEITKVISDQNKFISRLSEEFYLLNNKYNDTIDSGIDGLKDQITSNGVLALVDPAAAATIASFVFLKTAPKKQGDFGIWADQFTYELGDYIGPEVVTELKFSLFNSTEGYKVISAAVRPILEPHLKRFARHFEEVRPILEKPFTEVIFAKYLDWDMNFCAHQSDENKTCTGIRKELAVLYQLEVLTANQFWMVDFLASRYDDVDVDLAEMVRKDILNFLPPKI